MGSSESLQRLATFSVTRDFVDADDDPDALVELYHQNRLAWNAPNVRQLFAQRHYTLDVLRPGNPDCPKFLRAYPSNALQSPDCKRAYDANWDPYPFIYCPVKEMEGKHQPKGVTLGGEDARGRQIIAKVFDPKRDEGAIYRHLYKEGPYTLKANCMLPILDIIDFDEKVSFAVMPKWNPANDIHRARTIGDMFTFIHSLLKGMAYMHRNRIVHRDIRSENLVLNYGGFYNPGYSRCAVLNELRKAGKLCVAYIDFDVSKIYPPKTDLSTPRLRSDFAFTNSIGYPTPDLDQGEIDYNPFSVEVARLGYLLLLDFRHAILDVPTLAPLISMMTDWDVSRRFTAQEALNFCEKHCMPQAERVWDRIRVAYHCEPMEGLADEVWFDPWHMIPPYFAREWDKYRPRPMPLSRRLLAWICKRDNGRWMVMALRYFWRKLCGRPDPPTDAI